MIDDDKIEVLNKSVVLIFIQRVVGINFGRWLGSLYLLQLNRSPQSTSDCLKPCALDSTWEATKRLIYTVARKNKGATLGLDMHPPSRRHSPISYRRREFDTPVVEFNDYLGGVIDEKHKPFFHSQQDPSKRRTQKVIHIIFQHHLTRSQRH